jgi:glycosyltransferase involved in cell wall biosynthesis
VVGQGAGFERVEVIVVDNNSRDHTASVAARYAERYSNLRYVHERQQGLSHARNRGCDEACGEYVGYLDDDARLPRGYLACVLAALDEHVPDIMGGPVYPYYDTRKPRWFRDEYEIRKFAEASGFSRTCRVSGGNFIIRRDVLLRFGQFDVNLGMKGDQIGLGEERALLELYRSRTPEAAQKVYYCLNAHIEHYVPAYKMHRAYLIKRSFQSGRAMARITRQEASHALQRARHIVSDQLCRAAREIWKTDIRRTDFMRIGLDAAIRLGLFSEAFLISCHRRCVKRRQRHLRQG